MTNITTHLSNGIVLFCSITELLCRVGQFFRKILQSHENLIDLYVKKLLLLLPERTIDSRQLVAVAMVKTELGRSRLYIHRTL